MDNDGLIGQPVRAVEWVLSKEIEWDGDATGPIVSFNVGVPGLGKKKTGWSSTAWMMLAPCVCGFAGAAWYGVCNVKSNRPSMTIEAQQMNEVQS